jgi:heme O synthase-like polyprenyltransferase
MNTLVGTIIGSMPVYLGWVASGRSVCMVEPFAMFMYMIAWQYQHFYGIRWIYFDDYNNAGLKM